MVNNYLELPRAAACAVTDGLITAALFVPSTRPSVRLLGYSIEYKEKYLI